MLNQIQAFKQALANGQLAQNGGQSGNGPGRSGWGLGTSPYATQGSESQATAPENRLGNDSLMDTGTIDYQQLYESTDQAHGVHDEQLMGQLDLTQAPKKIEEVRSAPESQEALLEYSSIIGAYAEGEEAAILREQIPLEYQELVGDYFDQLKADSGTGSAGPVNDDEPSEESQDEPSEPEPEPEVEEDE